MLSAPRCVLESSHFLLVLHFESGVQVTALFQSADQPRHFEFGYLHQQLVKWLLGKVMLLNPAVICPSLADAFAL
jgi:hypothetical protein